MSLEYRQIEPAADLAPYVRHYWVLRGEAPPASLHPVFPDGCGEIVFNLGPAAREQEAPGHLVVQPRAMLVGQMTRPVRLVPGATLRMVGVKLAPWGAAALLGEEGVRVRDTTAALDELGAHSLQTVGERLCGCMSWLEAGLVLDTALRATMTAGSLVRLERIGRLARALRSAPSPSLSLWMRHLACSARTLERHFERCVGLAPKEFARLQRFQVALRLSSAHPALPWATVAARAGYSDQAHLGRDFRQFAGAAPTVAEAESTALSAAFVGGGEA